MSISMLQATVFKLNVLPKIFFCYGGEENYFVSVCEDSCPFLRDLSVWNEHQKRNDEKRDWKKIFSFNHIQSTFLMAYYFFIVGRVSRYMWIHLTVPLVWQPGRLLTLDLSLMSAGDSPACRHGPGRFLVPWFCSRWTFDHLDFGGWVSFSWISFNVWKLICVLFEFAIKPRISLKAFLHFDRFFCLTSKENLSEKLNNLNRFFFITRGCHGQEGGGTK